MYNPADVISDTTTHPAPSLTFSQIVILSIIVVPAPTNEHLPTLLNPATVAPGAIKPHAPIVELCETILPKFTVTPSSKTVSLSIIAPG